MSGHPHGGQQVLRLGGDPARARRVVIACHGRGADAGDMIGLARDLATPALAADTAWLAPQASGHSWYPYGFMAPLATNQPWLDSALQRIAELVAGFEASGVAAERVVLMGFSQGACLALESAARLGKRLGGVLAFSGGRIGPDGIVWTAPSPRLAGLPIFLGCSDRDPHIPLRRVQETSAFFRSAGARVDERIYPGLGHTINEDELDAARVLLAQVG